MAEIPREEIAAVLDDFTKKVIQQARRNLTLFSGNKTRALYNSFERDIDVFKDSINAVIIAEGYWRFTNYGVGGIKSSPIGLMINDKGQRMSYKQGATTFKGMPPPGAFKTDKINRIVSDSQAFASAVNVFKFGIKPTEFFTKPFETAFLRVQEEIEETYGLVIEKELKKELDDVTRK